MGTLIWHIVDWVGIAIFPAIPVRLLLRRVHTPERWALIAILCLFPVVAGAATEVYGYDVDTQLLVVGLTSVAIALVAALLGWCLGQPPAPQPPEPDSRR